MTSILLRDVEVDGQRVDVLMAHGKVVEIAERIRPTGVDEVVDGRGGALLPGLHDHHIHLLALAAARASVPVGPPVVTSWDQMWAALKAADAALPPGVWIRAVGYNERVAGPLDRHALDTAVPDRPVRVQHRSGALWVLNSVGLAATVGSGQNDSGVERGADGVPNGRLFRMDAWLGERLGVEERGVDLAAVGKELASYGVTGVTDATPYEDAGPLAALAAAVGVGDMPQHVVVTGGPGLDPDAVPALPRGPVKLLLHDHDLPPLGTVVGWVIDAHSRGRPVAVHCVTRLALVLTIAAFEETGTIGGDRVEHGAVIPVELFTTLRDLDLMVVTQPSFVAERGDDYLADVDPEDRGDLWRCATLQAAGIGVAGSTDAPFGDPNPWRAIAAAVERRTEAGHVLGPDERLPAGQALDLFLTSLDRPAGPPRAVCVGSPADLCLLATSLAATLAHPAEAHVVATFHNP